MSFKGRLISEPSSDLTGEGSTLYAGNTNSIIRFQSMISKVIVEFKGFITDMSDKFTSNWDSENVYGRMDPIGTFKNTQRSISLSWTIPAASIEEAKSNFGAIRDLTSMLYPAYSANKVNLKDKTSYTTANSLSKPPLLRLRYANLINNANPSDDQESSEGLLGWVDGFEVTPTLDMGFFIEGTNQFPKVYTMSCNFNVLHEHDLGFDSSGEWLGNNPEKFPFGGEE